MATKEIQMTKESFLRACKAGRYLLCNPGYFAHDVERGRILVQTAHTTRGVDNRAGRLVVITLLVKP